MTNPYLAPKAEPAVPRPKRHKTGLNTSLVVLLLTIIGGLALETWDHQSIVGSGPILFLTGVALLWFAVRGNHRTAIWLAASAIFLCVLVVFLINFNNWGPPEGDGPITLLAWTWSAVAVPTAIRLLTRGNSPA